MQRADHATTQRPNLSFGGFHPRLVLHASPAVPGSTLYTTYVSRFTPVEQQTTFVAFNLAANRRCNDLPAEGEQVTQQMRPRLGG